MTQVSVTSRTIAVEHIRISSGRPFAEVRRRLEGAVLRLDPGICDCYAEPPSTLAEADRR